MGKKQTYLKPDPDYIPDSLVDAVTYGTKLGCIPQEDGEWPPYAEVTISRTVKRQPRDRAGYTKPFMQLEIYETPHEKKWCSCCGEWVWKRGFSADKQNKDGLHRWCKSCRAEHAKKMYHRQREAVA